MASIFEPHRPTADTTQLIPEGEPQDMAALLAQENADYPVLRRGDIIEGEVVGWGRSGIVVDVGAKSEGVVPANEMYSLNRSESHRPQNGDKILVFVVQPENREGQTILSVDRARGERGWRILQDYFDSGESMEAEVIGYNKGGLLVDVEGLSAFVPISQLVNVHGDRRTDSTEEILQPLVGNSLRLKVIEINRRRSRAIMSERAAMQEWRSQQKERLLSEVKEGEIRPGRITSIRDFGLFVDLGGVDGLVHVSEIMWDKDKPLEEKFHIGDDVDVYILKVDHENRKIALSLRRAQPEQWQGLMDKYQIGQIVVGQVTKLTAFGAFARIGDGLEGLIHVSELSEDRITHPKEVVKEGDVMPLKIVRIERERHRLGLSRKQALLEAEAYHLPEDGSVGIPSYEIGKHTSETGEDPDPVETADESRVGDNVPVAMEHEET